MKTRVMVVDDDPDVRAVLSDILRKSDYAVMEAADAAALRDAFGGPQPAVVLLDLRLPDADGLDLVPEIVRDWPGTQVIILTGVPTFDAAVEATKKGAYDFVAKPFNVGELVHRVANAVKLWNYEDFDNTWLGRYVFESPKMKAVLRATRDVAATDFSVLVTGESGTGKEVIADLLHAKHPERRKGPCIKINCAALPRELIESELFGSVKGAYTGAQADRQGLFRQAEGGTLFLDELSEMPIDTQSKLLRVLQDKEVRPVGGLTTYKTDCRVVAATNRKVDEALRDGKLREDLYHRISAVTIHLPPLRERAEDVLPLAKSFLEEYKNQAQKLQIQGFSREAEERLLKHRWPGNVRELQNVVLRSVLMCKGQIVEENDLSLPAVGADDQAAGTLSLMEAMERDAIVKMLEETRGNKLEAAKRLGIGRQTLYNKIKAYGIPA